MNLIDQHGKAVDINDLPEEDQLVYINYELGYKRGVREATEAVVGAIMNGHAHALGFTYSAPGGSQPAKAAEAVALSAGTGSELTINLKVDGMRVASLPDRVTRRTVERDDRGQIVSTTDLETDVR